jgi:hypothetical protein
MISEHMRPLTRLLLFFIGLLLLGACLASSYQEWPLILSGKLPPLGFMITLIIAVIVSLVVIIIAFVGEKRVWTITDEGIEIKSHQFLRGSKAELIPLEKIHSIKAIHLDNGLDVHHEAHWLDIVIDNHKRLRSPVVSNKDIVLALGRLLSSKISEKTINGENR